ADHDCAEGPRLKQIVDGRQRRLHPSPPAILETLRSLLPTKWPGFARLLLTPPRVEAQHRRRWVQLRSEVHQGALGRSAVLQPEAAILYLPGTSLLVQRQAATSLSAISEDPPQRLQA